jgi:hypothetical protein
MRVIYIVTLNIKVKDEAWGATRKRFCCSRTPFEKSSLPAEAGTVELHTKFMDYLAMQCNKCGDFKGSVTPWSMILSGSIKYLPRLKPMFHR